MTAMPSLEGTVAALPLELARPWPDGVPKGDTPNERGECDSCRWPMQGDKLWWNGALMHGRCAARHEKLILGDDVHGLAEHLAALDDRHTFLRRLGREAARQGIDIQALARAVEKATANDE
jgi:hypothetical protein